MKKSGKIKRIWIAVLSGILAVSCTLSPAFAAESGSGPSLKIEAKSTSTGNLLPDAEFLYYQVADLSDRGIYSLTEDFKDSGLKLDEFTTASAMRTGARAANAYINEKKIEEEGTIVTDENGIGEAGNLKRGLYLLRLGDGGNDKLIVELEPFFVSVPTLNQETGKWMEQVTAQPKISTSVKPEETEKPTDPTEPTDPSEDPSKPSEEPTDPSVDPSNPSEEPTDPSKEPTTSPDDGGGDDDDDNGGGGGNPPGRHETPDQPGPGNPDVPVEIPDEPVPLSSFPGPGPGTPVEIEIPDGPVPLADLPHIPKLGDMGAGGYLAGMMISLILGGTALAVYCCTGRKEEK